MKPVTVAKLAFTLAALGAAGGIYGYAEKHQLIGLAYVVICGLIMGITGRYIQTHKQK